MSLALLAGAFGALAFSPQAQAQACAANGPCAAAMAMPAAADAGTNAIPDRLATCPVSGDKLGEMGKAYTFVYKGQQVKLCCKGCKKDFDKDPGKYLKLIRAADKKSDQK